MTLLRIDGLSRTYGAVRAVRNVSFAVERGSRTAIVGPSGSGKTTLLRLIAGFEAPDAGSILLDDTPMAGAGIYVPAHLRGIGFVPQDGALFPHLSVADNVSFGLPRNQPDRQGRIEALLDMVEIARGKANQRPHELSGGQQQRVALARALAREPRLMLLDEPFSALDTGLREAMRRTVSEVLRRAGVTTLLVTHDQREALSFADQVAVMRDGALQQIGTPQSLYRQPRDAATALFLGDAIILDAHCAGGIAECALGRFPHGGAPAQGPARIMLRPDQFCLVAAGAPGARHGQVVETEFAGALSTVTVAVGEGVAPIVLRAGTPVLPPVGADVAIAIWGEAHVLSG